VNVFEKNNIIAAVDFYHCRICQKKFADLRRIGIPFPLEPKLGFDELEDGNDWFILVCNYENKYQINLVQAKQGDEVKHTCIGGIESTAKFVSEEIFNKDDDRNHKFIRVSKYLTKYVEITGEA
jgi:hypothetical protein